MNRMDRIKFWSHLVIRVFLLAAAGISAYRENWISLALSLMALIMTFLPSMIEKRLNVNYPSELEIAVLLFIYASLYLGEVRGYYTKFWWWDVLLHGFSGLIMGIIGLSFLSILNRERRVSMKLGPGFVALFSFCFALAIGAIWEIAEFFMDSAFGLNMQKSGLVDTMWDLMMDVAGALVVSIAGYFYLKKDPKIIERFEKRLLK